jgi:hypothetical protein
MPARGANELQKTGGLANLRKETDVSNRAEYDAATVQDWNNLSQYLRYTFWTIEILILRV